MPQLDVSTYSAQLFWLLIAFCLLWGGMYLLLPRLGAVFLARSARIKKMVAEARRLEEQAEAILEAQEAHLKKERIQAKRCVEVALVDMHNRLRIEKQRLEKEMRAQVDGEVSKLHAVFDTQITATLPLIHKMADAFSRKLTKLYTPSN